VLLCLDERLDQYVVFTVGSTLHFLHTECLSPLGLKTGQQIFTILPHMLCNINFDIYL